MNEMNAFYERTARMLGEEAVEKLKNARIALFGLGGVGGHAAEALARAGVGHLTLVDGDTVSASNMNRQLFAVQSTVGLPKTEAAKRRLSDINPSIEIDARPLFVTADNLFEFDFSTYDYIIDAIDTVSSKIAIIMAAKETDTPIISCMGAGNKLDPTAFRVADIYQTSVCPLARVMRLELRRRGVKKLRVVYSEEPPVKVEKEMVNGKPVPGSVSFVPSVAGLILAGEAIKAIAGIEP